MKALLATHSLSVGYKHTTILKDINISIFPAEVVSLLGSNGIGKSTLLNKCHRFGKFLFRFAGKRHDHIRRDGAARKELPQKAHAFKITCRVILALHARQRGAASALHGQVEMGSEGGQILDLINKVLGHDGGIQGSQTDAPDVGDLVDLHQQILETETTQISPPCPRLNARQHDLPCASLGEGGDLGDHFVHRLGADGAAGGRDGAVGATVVATLCDLHISGVFGSGEHTVAAKTHRIFVLMGIIFIGFSFLLLWSLHRSLPVRL